MLAIGINESGSGTSNIAMTKNNLFGLNAVDATPGESSDYFATVEDCIKTYAYKWLSYGYVQPGDKRFKGANLGNKAEGLNLKYASDPFWGEKAASNYYKFDRLFGFQDKNSYTIAVLNNDYEESIYAKKTVNGDNISGYFEYKVKDSGVVVLEEILDESGKVWYKIQSDPNLDENQNYIGDSTSNPKINYNWNSFAYVSSDNFSIVLKKIEYEDEENNEISEEQPKNENQTEEVNQETPIENPTEEPVLEPEPIIIYKEITEIIDESGYTRQDNMITGIKLGTSTEEIINNFILCEAKEVAVLDINNQIKTGIATTGDKIVINNGEKQEIYDIVVYGDINGDGVIDKVDCTEILRFIYGYVSYEGAKLKALDTNKDGTIDKIDATQVLRQFYGYDEIQQ